MKVAFLGLGIMGRAMAGNLVKGGHEVTVWNRGAGAPVEGTQRGGNPEDAARGAEVVWLCVSDTAAVEHVVFGLRGVAGALAPGAVIADSSTISPAATVKFAERVRALGADWVDAPVTGSKIAAQNATLIFILGGHEASIEKIQPLLSAMGTQFFRMGDSGKGQSAKLVMNLQIAMIYEGFAEAVTLGAKLGVSLDSLLPLIQASMVRSGVIDYKAPFVQKHDFTPNFPLRLMLKDLKLILAAAKESRVKLPGLKAVEEIYDLASEEGHGDLDYAATLLLLEKWAGLKPTT